MKIRRHTISYGSYKKKLDNRQEQTLMSEIELSEQNSNEHNINEHNTKSKKEIRQRIRKSKLNGNFKRPMAQWM